MKPRSIWWAYKGYADVTGTLVEVTPSRDTKIDAVAGFDRKRHAVSIVVGNDGKAVSKIAVSLEDLSKVKKYDLYDLGLRNFHTIMKELPND